MAEKSSQLRRPPRHGCFLWWPLPGMDWIHEEDRFVAEHLIPGNRVFVARDDADGFNEYRYGRLSFRARPVMWTETPRPEFFLGDWVAVRSSMGRNAPRVAMVREVFWDRISRACRYQLALAGRRSVRLYAAEEMELSARIGEFPDRLRNSGPLREGGYLFERPFVPEVLDGQEPGLVLEAEPGPGEPG